GDHTSKPLAHPFNHFAERTFLVEGRKFANFFRNKRGPLGTDMLSKNFVTIKLLADGSKKRFKPKLDVWDDWHEHLNCHLLHLSEGRVDNTVPWDGSANAPILTELKGVWAKFLTFLNPLYEKEFEKHLRTRGL